MNPAQYGSLRLIALALILCAAAGLRLARLSEVPAGLWTDEANKALRAVALARGETPFRLVYFNEGIPKEGAFDSLLGLVVKAAGPNVVPLRATSALFGILAVLLLYLALRRETGEAVALAAAGVLATMFWHALFSRLLFRAIVLTPWLAGLFQALLALRRRPVPARAALLGFLIGGGFYTYPSWYFHLPWIAGAVAWLFWPWRAGRLRPVLAVWLAVAALLTAAPILTDYIRHPEHLATRAGAVSPFALPPAAMAREIAKNARDVLLMFHWRGEHQPLQNIPHKPALDPLQGLVFLLGLSYCASSLIRTRPAAPSRPPADRFLVATLLGWLACGLLATILTKTDSPNFLRTLPVTPAVAAITGLGLAAAARRLAARLPAAANQRRRHAVAVLIIAIVLSASAALTARDLYVRWGRDPEVWRAYRGDFAAMARQVALAPDDTAVFVPQFICENQTFRFFSVDRRNIYPYADWSFLRPWPPSAAAGERPAPRRRWVIATAGNRLLQPLEQLVPAGAVIKPFAVPGAGNTYAVLYAFQEADLPSSATLRAVETRWAGDLRI